MLHFQLTKNRNFTLDTPVYNEREFFKIVSSLDMKFDKCYPVSNFNELHEDLRLFITCLECHLGFELFASSAYRSQANEVAHGRDGSSAHCLGLAVDIYCYDNTLRYKIIHFAISYGIYRIGIYKNFIHIDIAPDSLKSQNIIWYG